MYIYMLYGLTKWYFNTHLTSSLNLVDFPLDATAISTIYFYLNMLFLTLGIESFSKAFYNSTSHILVSISHPEHHTSQTSHIPNIPYLRHPTCPRSHIPNLSHLGYPTSSTPDIIKIPHPQYSTKPTSHIPNILHHPTFYILWIFLSLSTNFRIHASESLNIHSTIWKFKTDGQQ